MAKKPTIMQMKEHVDMLTRQVNFQSRMMDSIGVAFSSYVRYKGDEEDFKKYLENNKNLHKLTEEENESREKGHIGSDNAVSNKEVRKEKDGKA
jgi:hypothetical protein